MSRRRHDAEVQRMGAEGKTREGRDQGRTEGEQRARSATVGRRAIRQSELRVRVRECSLG